MLKNILTLEGITILSKQEQNTIIAGTTGTCSAYIPCNLPGEHDDSCGGGQYKINVTKSEAQAFVAGGGRWCCESCDTASWAYWT